MTPGCRHANVRTITQYSQGARENLDASTLAAALRPEGSNPLHVQVEDRLRDLIQSGQVPRGAGLPGELELAAALALSRHTVRHALATLAAEGLVRRERGRGTRVVTPVAALSIGHVDQVHALAWEMTAQGPQQHARVLEAVIDNAPSEVAAHLMLSTDVPVTRIVRIRMANDEPLVIETAYLLPEYAEGLDSDALERGSVYDAIERRYGLRVTRAQEIIMPMVLSRSDARRLHVRTGAAAFRVERTTWAGTKPIEWQESILRGDRFVYSVELRRTPIHTPPAHVGWRTTRA